jgi:hypothetical protein
MNRARDAREPFRDPSLAQPRGLRARMITDVGEGSQVAGERRRMDDTNGARRGVSIESGKLCRAVASFWR